jgi:hypothetical protein
VEPAFSERAEVELGVGSEPLGFQHEYARWLDHVSMPYPDIAT